MGSTHFENSLIDNTKMNSPPVSMPMGSQQDADEFDLLSLVDAVIDSRWLIAGVATLVLILAVVYASYLPPVYEANTLIQVEESKPGAGGALGEAANLFEIRSPATAEMEIIRSRLVVGDAVDELQLNVTATPRYLPLVGEWMSRRATGLSNPGFMGQAGYVSGTESIRLARLELPAELEGKALVLVVTPGGYELSDPGGKLLATGTVGKLVEIAAGKGGILVADLQAKPGAHFIVTRRSRLAVIEGLQRRLMISEKGRQSGVIAVSLEGAEPQLISNTLKAVGRNYVRQNVERKSAEAEKTLEFLSGFLPQLKKQLEESETKFNQFRNQNATFDLSVEGRSSLETAVKLQSALLELKQKRLEQSALYTPLHPNILVLDSQIAGISREIATLTTRVKTLPNIEQNLLRLTRDVKVNSELYLNLLNSSQQLRLVKEGKVGNVRVVDTAVSPERSIKPNRQQIVILGGVVGTLLGIAIALLRARVIPRIKDSAQIESATGLNVFVTVPHSEEQVNLFKFIKARARGEHLLAITQPDAPSIESLRSLRTALQFALLDAGNNIIIFSGPTPGIGKSFVSANFSAVLGAAGKRVLLIDGDMRRGHIHQYFGLDRGFGLSELITGVQTPVQVIHKSVAPGLDLITTGVLPPNPAELLLSSSTAQLLQNLSSQYDMVLIDTPPVLAVSDAQVLGTHGATLFLVARANVTTVSELQEAAKRLAQTGVPVKGVVFNDLDSSRKRYGGYGYKYTNYKYGKGTS
jgi:tyrosine-protein kinase Etk/Wzc